MEFLSDGDFINIFDNATLFCHANGSWAEKSSYNMCFPMDQNLLPLSPARSIKLIFYIGNSMSLVAVLIALWIFLSFKDLWCLRNKIHTNLLATFLLHNVFWIASASLHNDLGEFMSCFFFVFLNYSTLTNFFWMFVEGLYLYMLVVETFSAKKIKLRIYALIGWGLSIPIVISWLVIRLQVPASDVSSVITEEGLDGTCPLYMEDVLDWITRVPVLLVLTFNIIFLIRIMWVLITKLRSANTVETKRYWKASKALLVLIPLLGLTYMLLIALPQEFEHFRSVLLSTQGFWVALFYCFLNSEVRNSIHHHIQRWRTERGIIHSRGTSMSHFKSSSPKWRASGNLSHYSCRLFGSKRESLACSEITTMTTFVTNGYNSQTTASAPQQSIASAPGSATTIQVSHSLPRDSPYFSSSSYSREEGETLPQLSVSIPYLAEGQTNDNEVGDIFLNRLRNN